MIKLNTILCVLFLMSSCATAPVAHSTNKNDKCISSNKLQIMQVFDSGVLAHLCPVDFPSYYENEFDACTVKGDLIFMAVKAKNNDYVDDQKVTLTDDKCFVADGVYTYITKNENQKRVRKIKIIDSELTLNKSKSN